MSESVPSDRNAVPLTMLKVAARLELLVAFKFKTEPKGTLSGIVSKVRVCGALATKKLCSTKAASR